MDLLRSQDKTRRDNEGVIHQEEFGLKAYKYTTIYHIDSDLIVRFKLSSERHPPKYTHIIMN